MHARIYIKVGVPTIESYRTDPITEKSTLITIEPKLTHIPDIYPTKLPRVPSATIISLSVGDSSNLNLLANLSEITYGMAQESKKL